MCIKPCKDEVQTAFRFYGRDERFENALVCKISRFRPILNFSIFRQNGASLELLNIFTVFENSLPKGSFGEIRKIRSFLNCMAPDSGQLPTTALKYESFSQILLPTIFFCFFYVPHFARAQLVRFCHVFGRKLNSSLF